MAVEVLILKGLAYDAFVTLGLTSPTITDVAVIGSCKNEPYCAYGRSPGWSGIR